jgi:serine/threonine-protein kinase
MFLDEARLCAYLSHSRCVQVFDIGQAGGSHFIVMVSCVIALGVCEGLSYAHQACDHQGNPLNIVHRDISPHNVLLTKFGEVKLVDFGLAKASSHLVEEDQDIVKGKFGYLAPEVTLGQPSDHRVDIFATGILLWEMLAGRRLFRGESDVETFKLVRATEVPDILEIRSEVPEMLAQVLTRALARDPVQRYRSADDFAKDLSLVLMQADLPVTYVDLGKLVREAAASRTKKKAAGGQDTRGMVGDLILDTLHDFSAEAPPVAEGGNVTLGSQGVSVGGGGFVDPAAWGLDALFDEPGHLSSAPPRRRTPAPPPAAAAAGVLELEEGSLDELSASAPPPSRSAAERARPPAPSEKKEGPFWRRWFGG